MPIMSGPTRHEHRRPVRVLLINPRFPESFWSFRWAVTKILPRRCAMNPPLGLATLAALCPREWDVRIVDENIESIPLEPHADIVGVCGMAVQFPRQRELLGYYRRLGYHVVAGGSYASLCPERYQDLADTVISGEAEYIWPEFCRDFAAGNPRAAYRETGIVDLADSPTPRFDLLRLDRYLTVSMQFSRGCPYRCEFCDIIVMFGRRPRTKSPEQIGRELDLLRSLGARNVFFVDDNLIGDRPKAKALLGFLADYERRHGSAFQFGTEASINLSEDENLMDLFRAARFGWVFVGIESPDAASLRETGKTQNTRGDLLESIRRLYRHGIDVLAGFIVGFDNDTIDTFEQQRRFITASGIQVAMVGLLQALPKTPLHARLQSEGRLRERPDEGDNTRPGTNFIPMQMDYDCMVGEYKSLYRRLVSDRSIADRIGNKTRDLREPVHRDGYDALARLSILGRFTLHGLLPGGPQRWYHFLRSILIAGPHAWPLAISEWITALSTAEYVRRYFSADPARDSRIVDRARRALDQYAQKLKDGLATISVEGDQHLILDLAGSFDRRFWRKASRQLSKLLGDTTATLTLRIEQLEDPQREHLGDLLHRLRDHGHRVTIQLGQKVRQCTMIDSSVFHLALAPS